jgi:TonB-linked SusC/RagA family outer membrane protein
MRRILFIMLMLSMSVGMTFSQRTVTGSVTDSSGEPLIGASVVAKDRAGVGTITDFDGNFELSIPEDVTTLVVSYTGFNSEEVVLGSSNTVNVALSEGVMVDELVVTGLGIKRDKRALGYAVTTLESGLIEKRPDPDVGRVLQGKIPGVNITSTSGVSGTGTNIIIRGYSSITGSNQPLWVVDGVPINTNTNTQSGFTTGGQTTSSRMLDLDPNSIESISVLKGLSATVLYGDQGRNGVILVTTKAGGEKKKTADITISQSYFQNRIASLPDYQNNYGGGFQQLTGDAWFFSNWGADFRDVTEVPHPVGMSAVANIRNAFPEYAVDPTQAWGPQTAATRANIVRFPNMARPTIGESFFRTGNVHQTSLQVQGSSGSTGYTASFGYQDEEGFTPGNNLSRLNFGLGLQSAVTEKISIRSSFQFANTDMTTPPLNAGFGSNAANDVPSTYANVLYTPRNVDLLLIPNTNPLDGSSVYYRGGNDITHPLWLVNNYTDASLVNRFMASTAVNYDMNENFSLVYRVGLDTYNETQERRYNKGGTGNNQNIIGGMYQTIGINNVLWNHDVNLNYNNYISDKLNFSVMLGANSRFDRFEQTGLASTGQLALNLFNHRNFENVSSRNPLTGAPLNYVEEVQRVGVYGNAILDYDDYLYLNVSARNDWISTVETENRSILYPGVSLSFVPTSAFDNFAPGVFDYLKIRAGYGSSAGFPGPYSTRSVIIQNARAFLPDGGQVFPSHTISTFLGNPNLKPELQQEIEVGTEAVMLDRRLRIDLSLYERNTRDLITNAPIDPSTGFTSTAINIGNLRTRGIDLMATVNPLRSTRGLNWDITANFGLYRSIVTELSEDLDQIAFAGFSDLGNFAIPGKPYGTIMGIGIQRTPDGQPIVLSNGRYWESDDIQELGDPNPAWTGSLINSLSYKNFNLNFMMEYRHKGVIVSNTVKGVLARGLSTDTDQLDRALSLILPGVKQDGVDDMGNPVYVDNDIQVTASNYFFDNYFFTDEAITFDASTIRLREVSLTYQLPSNLVGRTPFKAASLSLSGSNLWFRALNMPKGVNFDTDVLSLGVGNGLGFDYLTGPSARRFGGTLSITF